MPSYKSWFAIAAIACLANAETFKITAKSDSTFDPDTVTAKSGDLVEFHFEPSNHSVVSGDYQFPCSPLQLGKGFYSGYVSSDSGEADKIFRVTVNSTEPQAFYSSQSDECAKGMVGIINPTDSKNLTDYKKRAAKLSKAVTPGKNTFGGQLVDNSDSSDDKSSDDKGSGDHDKNSATGPHQVSIVALLSALGVALVL